MTIKAQTGVDVEQLVDIIRKIGGGVRPEEIHYQLARAGTPATELELIEALCAAEARGLITPWAWTLGIEAQR